MLKILLKLVKCVRKIKLNSTVKQPMVITSTSSEPFEKIFLDIVGSFPNTFNGNKYILTIQDD
jgi:hypothetical protein